MNVADVDVPVVGGHAGITILPLFSQASPGHSMDKATVEALTKRTQEGGTEVVQAKAGKVQLPRSVLCGVWPLDAFAGPADVWQEPLCCMSGSCLAHNSIATRKCCSAEQAMDADAGSRVWGSMQSTPGKLGGRLCHQTWTLAVWLGCLPISPARQAPMAPGLGHGPQISGSVYLTQT